MRMKKTRCEIKGCDQDATARGKCSRHYQAFWVRWRRECLKNGSLVETPPGVLPEPKWSWEGDEQSLIEATELAEGKSSNAQ